MRRFVACALVTVLALLLWPTAAAYASTLTGPPDTDGHYLHCRFYTSQSAFPQPTGANQLLNITIRCQYGPTTNSLVNSSNTVFTLTTNGPYGSGGNAAQCRLDINAAGTGSGQQSTTIVTNTGGLFKMTTTLNGSTWPAGGQTQNQCGTSLYGVSGPSSGTTSTSTGGCKVAWQAANAGYTDTSSTSESQCQWTYTGIAASGAGEYPLDNWSGGTAGAALDVASPTATCSRRLSAGNGTWTAFFTGGVSAADSHATDTYSWAFGDSTTSTTQSPSHNYANAGPFTAVETVTRSTSSGHTFSDGSVTQTSTCNSTVDFNNPTNPTTTSTTNSVPGDNGTGSGSCDLWDVGCWVTAGFRALFFPSSNTRDGASNLWGDLTTKAPFSIMYEAVTWIPARFSDLKDAIENGYTDIYGRQGDACGNLDPSGPNVPVTTKPTCTSGKFAIPATAGSSYNSQGNTSFMRQIFLVVIGLLWFYGVYRGIGEAIK